MKFSVACNYSNAFFLAVKPPAVGLNFGRIAKPLRGGGGGQPPPTGPLTSGTNFANSPVVSPLNRVQAEESRYAFLFRYNH